MNKDKPLHYADEATFYTGCFNPSSAKIHNRISTADTAVKRNPQNRRYNMQMMTHANMSS